MFYDVGSGLIRYRVFFTVKACSNYPCLIVSKILSSMAENADFSNSSMKT